MSSSNPRNTSAHLAEINVTPLIDVMLTVLVIFMITAPVVSHTIPVPLSGSSGTPSPAHVYSVAIAGSGALSLNATPTTLGEMEALIGGAATGREPVRIELKPDAGSSYDDLIDVLAMASRHGVTDVRIEGVARGR